MTPLARACPRPRARVAANFGNFRRLRMLRRRGTSVIGRGGNDWQESLARFLFRGSDCGACSCANDRRSRRAPDRSDLGQGIDRPAHSYCRPSHRLGDAMERWRRAGRGGLVGLHRSPRPDRPAHAHRRRRDREQRSGRATQTQRSRDDPESGSRGQDHAPRGLHHGARRWRLSRTDRHCLARCDQCRRHRRTADVRCRRLHHHARRRWGDRCACPGHSNSRELPRGRGAQCGGSAGSRPLPARSRRRLHQAHRNGRSARDRKRAWSARAFA